MAPARIHALPNVGDRYVRWTVIGLPIMAASKQLIPCRCECGCIAKVVFSNLYRGISKSCGCRAREVTANRNRKHSESGTRLHRIWKGMRTRCTNPSQTSYRDYGARGVRVCAEWDDFSAFREWALVNGYSDALEIDRIDVTGNYEPTNCRFVTHRENSWNKRRHRMVAAFGESKPVSAWAADQRARVKAIPLLKRLNRGWSPERAITEPSHTADK
jgi:hypothetical protein